jgi:hypothetical protein
MVPKHASMCLFTWHEAAEAQVNKRIVPCWDGLAEARLAMHQAQNPFSGANMTHTQVPTNC